MTTVDLLAEKFQRYKTEWMRGLNRLMWLDAMSRARTPDEQAEYEVLSARYASDDAY